MKEKYCICKGYAGQTFICPIEEHKKLFEKYVAEYKQKQIVLNNISDQEAIDKLKNK